MKIAEIYRTKGKVLHVKTSTHKGSYTFCQLISRFSSLFVSPLDKENEDLFLYGKGSTFPCFHGGCVSHLQLCEFISDCPTKEEGVRCGEYVA